MKGYVVRTRTVSHGEIFLVYSEEKFAKNVVTSSDNSDLLKGMKYLGYLDLLKTFTKPGHIVKYME